MHVDITDFETEVRTRRTQIGLAPSIKYMLDALEKEAKRLDAIAQDWAADVADAGRPWLTLIGGTDALRSAAMAEALRVVKADLRFDGEPSKLNAPLALDRLIAHTERKVAQMARGLKVVDGSYGELMRQELTQALAELCTPKPLLHEIARNAGDQQARDAARSACLGCCENSND